MKAARAEAGSSRTCLRLGFQRRCGGLLSLFSLATTGGRAVAATECLGFETLNESTTNLTHDFVPETLPFKLLFGAALRTLPPDEVRNSPR